MKSFFLDSKIINKSRNWWNTKRLHIYTKCRSIYKFNKLNIKWNICDPQSNRPFAFAYKCIQILQQITKMLILSNITLLWTFLIQFKAQQNQCLIVVGELALQPEYPKRQKHEKKRLNNFKCQNVYTNWSIPFRDSINQT